MKYPMKSGLLLALAVTAGLLCACSKEKKAESSEPQTEQTDDFAPSSGETPDAAEPSEEETRKAAEAIEHIDKVKDFGEMDVAIKGLQHDVAVLQDLLKKYRATGEAKYKEQAQAIAEKARAIQEKIREAGVLPQGKQMVNAGDLFGELEKAMAEFQ